MGRVQDGWKISHIAIENNKQAQKKKFSLLGVNSALFWGRKLMFAFPLPFHFENRYTKDISLSPPPRHHANSSRVWELFFARASLLCETRFLSQIWDFENFSFLPYTFALLETTTTTKTTQQRSQFSQLCLINLYENSRLFHNCKLLSILCLFFGVIEVDRISLSRNLIVMLAPLE